MTIIAAHDESHSLPVLVDTCGSVAADVSCIACGYNLRTCAADGACPECGTPVVQSLRRDLLQFAPRGKVKLIAAGVGVGLAAAAIHLLLIAIGWASSMAGWTGMGVVYYHTLRAVPAHVLAVIAVFLVTARLPADRTTVAAVVGRWGMLIVTVAALVLIVAEVWTYTPAGPAVPWLYHVTKGLNILTGWAWVAVVAATVVHVSGLATRIPDRRLARRITWCGAAFVGAGFFMTLSSLLFLVYFEFLFDVRRGNIENDPLFIALRIFSMSVLVAWGAITLWCCAVGAVLLARLVRVPVRGT